LSSYTKKGTTFTDTKICTWSDSDDGINCDYTDLQGSGGDEEGGWVNSSEHTNTTLDVYIKGNATVGNLSMTSFSGFVGHLIHRITSSITWELPNFGGTLVVNDTSQVQKISNATHGDTCSAFLATPTKCNAGEYPLGVDVYGNADSCTDATTEINTEIGNVLDGTDTFTDFNGQVIDSDNYVADSIDDTHINWGTGANQISNTDIPNEEKYVGNNTPANFSNVNIDHGNLTIVNGTHTYKWYIDSTGSLILVYE